MLLFGRRNPCHCGNGQGGPCQAGVETSHGASVPRSVTRRLPMGAEPAQISEQMCPGVTEEFQRGTDVPTGDGGGGGAEQRSSRGAQGNFRVIGAFMILVVLMVSWVWTCHRSHCVLCFNYVQWIVWSTSYGCYVPSRRGTRPSHAGGQQYPKAEGLGQSPPVGFRRTVTGVGSCAQPLSLGSR